MKYEIHQQTYVSYFLSTRHSDARGSRNHFFFFFCFSVSGLSLILSQRDEFAMGYVSTWMGDRLSSRPAMGCI